MEGLLPDLEEYLPDLDGAQLAPVEGAIGRHNWASTKRGGAILCHCYWHLDRGAFFRIRIRAVVSTSTLISLPAPKFPLPRSHTGSGGLRRRYSALRVQVSDAEVLWGAGDHGGLVDSHLHSRSSAQQPI